MNIDEDASTDEYFVTAIQIFDYCGADSTGILRVDDLMDKFAPFVKSNKAEFGTKIAELKSLLDPDDCNPEITVKKLAMILNKCSDSQRIKVDLEESFNLKTEQTPHDSDSGISTDGLLEELQCELREKCHQALRLRSQLDFTDRQHEEALAALGAERDALRAHLNVLREENVSLMNVRRDYDDASERLCACERMLDETRRELEVARRRARSLHEQVVEADAEKSTLQDQLVRSKEECHRINEMYASRQTALRQENEALRAERADLASRLQDQEEFMQQLIKEKVLLEMELKDVLNKSNQPPLRAAERSIDVSYTDEQMLSQLDSLNADSRFVQDAHLLDEESFINALRDDQGRSTNASLFQELRFSICNMSRNDIERRVLVTVETQTDHVCSENELTDTQDMVEISLPCTECSTPRNLTSLGTQTDMIDEIAPYDGCNKVQMNIIKCDKCIGTYDQYGKIDCSQTNINENDLQNNNSIQNCIDCSKCMECERLKIYTTKLEQDNRHCHETMSNMQIELVTYEVNLKVLKRFVDEANKKNKSMEEFIESLKTKLVALEAVCERQGHTIRNMSSETNSVKQTEYELSSVSTQTEVPHSDCVSKRSSHRSFKKYLWEPLRSLLQLLAVLCFACAASALYAVAARARVACRERPGAVPWRWLHAQDLLDMLLRVDYVADVPM